MEFDILIQRAQSAKAKAIAPYSRFPVGAALLAADDTIYDGCNIESSSYGLTMCAERVALFKALSEGKTEFRAIAISADTDEFCPPCGACRQVLWDFARNIDVILVSQNQQIETHKLSEFFPYAFDQDFFKQD